LCEKAFASCPYTLLCYNQKEIPHLDPFFAEYIERKKGEILEIMTKKCLNAGVSLSEAEKEAYFNDL
jgi:hypothetical protein